MRPTGQWSWRDRLRYIVLPTAWAMLIGYVVLVFAGIAMERSAHYLTHHRALYNDR